MEYTTFPLLLIAIIIAIISGLIIKSLLVFNQYKHAPGPRPRLPIIGNLLLLYQPGTPMSERTSHVIRYLQKSFPNEGMLVVFYSFKVIVFIQKPLCAIEFLKNNSAMDKSIAYDVYKVWLGNGLITANGKTWKNKRKILNPTFHSKILENYIPLINEECLKLIVKLQEATDEPYIDVRSVMSETMLNIIAATAMGISLDQGSLDVEEYHECVHRVPNLISSRYYNPLNLIDFIFYRRNIGKQLLSDVQKMKSFIRSIITRRKMDCNRDLITAELRAKSFLDLLLDLQNKDNALTDEEIQEEVETFLFAGHDTSSISLTWTLLLLGNHLESQRKLANEIIDIFGSGRLRYVNKEDINRMHYAECVIKESLRLFPSVPNIARDTCTEMFIGGHKFPKGTTVLISLIAAQRDEASFRNALEFIPERFENNAEIQNCFIPFAVGSRNCIGQRFAMIEMKMVLAHIFSNFTIKSLDKEHDVPFSSDVVLKPLKPVKITFNSIK